MLGGDVMKKNRMAKPLRPLSRLRERASVRALSFWFAALFGLLLVSLAPRAAVAQPPGGGVFEVESEPVHHVTLTINKSRTFRIAQAFSTAVVGAPEIADVRPMSDHVIYVQAKKIGTTNLVAFDSDMKVIGVMDIEVTPDTSALQDRMKSAGAGGIRVSSSNGQFILSGTAPSAVVADQAVSIAKSFAVEGGGQGQQAVNVVNAITVAQAQQVMLKVRFLEVSRTAGRDLGFNWYVGNASGTRGFSTGLGTPTVTPVPGTGTQPVPVFGALSSLLSGGTPFGVALANLASGGTTVDLLISALEQKGLVRRLAEPDLVALSGDTAAFIAGGEFPVPVVQPGSAGGTAATVTIEFKPFGVQLTFSPTVLSNGVINLRLAPSVSELDFANSVVIAGTAVPSLIKREARTTIELRDGQSFAIAGLLQSHDRRNVSQLPWIGNVPVLGELFRSNDYQKDETDLVVIVTPHLIMPAAPNQKIATPLDKSLPSNDVDFFLLGEMEKRKDFSNYRTNGNDVVGPYGYILRTDHAVAAAPEVAPRDQTVIHNK
jgi:pilus assembly protein CpaC